MKNIYQFAADYWSQLAKESKSDSEKNRFLVLSQRCRLLKKMYHIQAVKRKINERIGQANWENNIS